MVSTEAYRTLQSELFLKNVTFMQQQKSELSFNVHRLFSNVADPSVAELFCRIYVRPLVRLYKNWPSKSLRK